MKLDAALQKLLRERRKLDKAQGRIARRNARRLVIGALRSVRSAIDAEYPAIAKPVVQRDPLDVAADTMSWRQFEYGVIAHLRREWSLETADRFHRFACLRLGVTPKPLSLDSGLGRRLIGQHRPDEIKLATGLDREEKWRTLMHEIAHYREGSHGRKFVRELALVYRTWKEFVVLERVAAELRRPE